MSFLNLEKSSLLKQKNYIQNPLGAFSTSGWTRYKNTTPGTTPEVSPGGTPDAGFTFALNSTTPLEGFYSFALGTTAANLQGNGVYYEFTLDRMDYAKALQVRFDYKVMSGTYATGDLVVYLIDTTNSTVIQPSAYQIQNATNNAQFAGTFQTSASGTTYRLVIHRAVTTASASSVYIDNVVVSPNLALYGSPITDWQSFTPTGSWTTNTTYTGAWRRVGDSMELWYKIATSGAPTSAVLAVNMPTGYNIDTSKFDNDTDSYVNGQVSITDAGVATYIGRVRYVSATQFELPYLTSTDVLANTTQAAPMTFGSGDEVHVHVTRIPITGWSSSVQMSDANDQRIVAAKYGSSQTTALTATDTVINFDTLYHDTHSAVTTGASWKFTAPVPGYYRIKSQMQTSSTAATTDARVFSLTIYKNGSTTNFLNSVTACTVTAYRKYVQIDSVIQLNAGDYIDIRNSGSNLGDGHSLGGNPTTTFVDIQRLSGPSQIGATETVAARVTSTDTTAITNATTGTVVWNGSTYDTHGAVSSNKFNAPVSGRYRMSVVVAYANSTNTVNGYIYGTLRKNGSTNLSVGVPFIYQTTSSLGTGYAFTDTVQLNAGDYIEVRITNQSGSTKTPDGTAIDNYWTIERIGN